MKVTITMIVDIPEECDIVETVDNIVLDIEMTVGPVVKLSVSDDDQDYIDR